MSTQRERMLARMVELEAEAREIEVALRALDAEGPWSPVPQEVRFPHDWEEVGPWVPGRGGNVYRCGRCTWDSKPAVAVVVAPDGSWEGRRVWGNFGDRGEGGQGGADWWLLRTEPNNFLSEVKS